MKKIFQNTTLLICCMFSLSANAQEEVFPTATEVRNEIESSQVMTASLLCNRKWRIERAAAYYTMENPADNWIFDMPFEGYSYTFHTDGTFDCEAVISTDGTWELRNGGKLLYLYNNLREDEELHEIALTKSGMKWYMLDEEMILRYDLKLILN